MWSQIQLLSTTQDEHSQIADLGSFNLASIAAFEVAKQSQDTHFLHFLFQQAGSSIKYTPGTFFTIQRLSFKLLEGNESRTQHFRLIIMQFYSLGRQNECISGLMDLKYGSNQGKAKIVAYCEQSELMDLLEKANQLKIDITNTPIILTNSFIGQDFSTFSGWNQDLWQDHSTQHLSTFQKLAKKWIKSSREKVDLWQISIKFQEDGKLERLGKDGFQTLQVQSKFQQKFISHVSFGYHVKLSKKIIPNRTISQCNIRKNIKYIWQAYKTFCCLGSSQLSTSTNVVDIVHTNEQNEQTEILKHLRQYDGSQLSQLEASKIIKSDKGIVSLLLTNIDRFHGSKLEGATCKPNDGKLDLIIFKGHNKFTKLASMGGQIAFRFETQNWLEFQVGSNIYRIWGCREFKIRQTGRVKISINKELLQC